MMNIFYVLKECIILNPPKNADSHESYQSYYRPELEEANI